MVNCAGTTPATKSATVPPICTTRGGVDEHHHPPAGDDRQTCHRCDHPFPASNGAEPGRCRLTSPAGLVADDRVAVSAMPVSAPAPTRPAVPGTRRLAADFARTPNPVPTSTSTAVMRVRPEHPLHEAVLARREVDDQEDGRTEAHRTALRTIRPSSDIAPQHGNG